MYNKKFWDIEKYEIVSQETLKNEYIELLNESIEHDEMSFSEYVENCRIGNGGCLSSLNFAFNLYAEEERNKFIGSIETMYCDLLKKYGIENIKFRYDLSQICEILFDYIEKEINEELDV